MRAAITGCTVVGTCIAVSDPVGVVGAARADQRAELDERAHALLEEERIAAGALGEQPLQRLERRVVAEQRIEQVFGARARADRCASARNQGLAPFVLVFGAIVHQQQHARERQALDQAVQDRLGLGIDPVQVLEHHQQRLDLALAQQQALHRLEGALAALLRDRAFPTPRRANGVSSSASNAATAGVERFVERQELPRDLLADRAVVVAVVDLEVALEADRSPAGRRSPCRRTPSRSRASASGSRAPSSARIRRTGATCRRRARRRPRRAGRGRPRLLPRRAQLLQLGAAADEARQAAGRRRLQPRAHRLGAGQLIGVDRLADALDAAACRAAGPARSPRRGAASRR